MTEYTKEKCYGNIGIMAGEMISALARIEKSALERHGGGEEASDSEIDCAIRFKVAAELVAKVREDFCDGK